MNVMKLVLWIISFLIFHPFSFAIQEQGDSGYPFKKLFRGEIEQIQQESNIVLIRSSQGKVLAQNRILYIHDPQPVMSNRNLKSTPKAILRVIKWNANILKAKVLFGRIQNIQIGEIVHNFYRWNAHEYVINLSYLKGSEIISVKETMVLPLWVEVVSKNKARYIANNQIQSIDIKYSKSKLNVRRIHLKDKTQISQIQSTNLNLDRYLDQQVSLKVRNLGLIKLSASDLKKIDVSDKKSGVFKARTFHSTLGSSVAVANAVDMDSDDSKRYTVRFRFLNRELIPFLLESRLTKETNPKKIQHWIQTLIRFNPSQIRYVALVGSFNDWNVKKGIMTKRSDDVYELILKLQEGIYPYYFVIYLNGAEPLAISLSDPYYVDRYMGKDECSDNQNEQTKCQPAPLINHLNGYSHVEDEQWFDRYAISKVRIPGYLDKEIAQENLSITDSNRQQKEPLTFDEQLIALEQNNLKNKYQSRNSIIIDKPIYRKVHFIFDQIYLIRNELKMRINQELKKSLSDSKKIQKYQHILNNLDETKVKQVFWTSSYNNWNKKTHLMTLANDGTWSLEVYLPKGKHSYAYVIDLGIADVKEAFLMPDLIQKSELMID